MLSIPESVRVITTLGLHRTLFNMVTANLGEEMANWLGPKSKETSDSPCRKF